MSRFLIIYLHLVNDTLVNPLPNVLHLFAMNAQYRTVPYERRPASECSSMATIDEDVAEDTSGAFGYRAVSPEWRMAREEVDLDVWKPVGEGGFGKLYLGSWLNSTVV